LHVQGGWFSPGIPASSTTKTYRHDIAEILLKVALKHQKYIINATYQLFCLCHFDFYYITMDHGR
jgi:hypothetical protein